MKRENHIRTIRPYLAMLIAMAMLLTSFATPSVAFADDGVETETVENAVAASEASETEAETETLEESDGEAGEDTSENVFDTQEITETEWTVYIYMCGSNLESEYGLASGNIKNLLKAPKNDQVRYIVETGGADKWTNEKVDASRRQRFLIQGDEMTLVFDEPICNMADAGNLSDFIKWGKENYPSEKSMLCMWNHGGGMKGVCWGEPYDDHLSIPDLRNELAMSEAHFDIIGFDACLMANFDALASLEAYADYFVASQEIEPGWGWDYFSYGSYLAENPTCSAKQFACKLCDCYVDNLTNLGENGTTTLAVIEAAALPDVKNAVDDMMEAVNAKITDKEAFTTLLALAYQSKHYFYDYDKDLVSLAKSFAPVLGDEIYYEVKEAVMDAVVYRTQMNEAIYNNGISITWAPLLNSNNMNIYAEVAASDEYLRFIDAVKYNWHGSSELYKDHDRVETVDPDLYKLEYETKPGRGPVESLVVTNAIETVASITYAICKDEDGYIFKIAEKGNLDVSSGDTFTPVFDGKIATIDNIPIVMEVSFESDDYTLYDVPIYAMQEGKEDRMNLRVAYYPPKRDDSDSEKSKWVGNYGSEEDGYFKIIGISNEGTSASDFAERDVKRLESGMQITTAYPEINEDGIVFYRKGETFTYSELDTTVLLSDLEDGEYYISYSITTTLGEEIYTSPQQVEIVNGVIKAVPKAWAAPVKEEEPELLHIPCVSADRFYAGKTDETPEEEAEEADAADAKITVLMYMDGADLDVEGEISGIIGSMLNTKETDEVNLILETGGCDSWHNDTLKNDAIQRFEVHEGTLVEVETLPNDNFATEYTLENFLKWGVSNYPAEKYILMMYDHGGAWRGNSVDRKYGNSMISLSEIAEALENSGVHYDLIYFNCCLMATAEVCAKMAPYADYFIGSEESVFSLPKLDQSETFTYFARHANDFDTEKYGKFVVDHMVNGLEASQLEYATVDFQQMSLIDLRKIDKVTEAVNRLGGAMKDLESDPEALSKLLLSIDDTRNFAYEFQRDLVDFANHAEGVDPEIINEVINAVDDAVVSTRSINDHTRSCGLAICYPYGYEKGYNEYAKICPFKDYLAFFDSVTLNWHAYPGTYEDVEAGKSVNPFDYKPDYEIVSLDDKTAALKINSGISTYNKIYYKLSKIDPDGYRFHEISKMGNIDIDVDSEDNIVFKPMFDGRVLTLDGIPCYVSIYKETENSIIYSIPAKVKGYTVYILIKCVPEKEEGEEEALLTGGFELDKCKYSIIGAIPESDMLLGIPERDLICLTEGDEFTLVHHQTNSAGEEIYSETGETITYTKDLDVKIVNLDDGEYRLNFEIVDGLMNTVRSKDINVVIKYGRIQQEIIPEAEEKPQNEETETEETEEAEETETVDAEAAESEGLDVSKLKYCSDSDSEDVPVVYFMPDVTVEEAQALSSEGMKVVAFEADQNLGFYGSVAANCIDFEQLYKDYAEDLTDDAQDTEEAETEETADEEVPEETDDAFVNVIEGFGMLASSDPVALDQACLDIMAQIKGGSDFLYNVMECHGVELLEQAEKTGCGMRHYRLEFIDRTAE